MRFADIPGIPELKRKLAETVDQGHIAHAQLFAGAEGGVGLMLALAYAQYVNCEAPSEKDSCGVCPSCIKTSKFIHPDLHFCMPIAKVKKEEDKKETKVQLTPLLPAFRLFLHETPFGSLWDWSEAAEFENRTPGINILSVRETIIGLQLKPYEGRFKIQLIWLPETMRTEGANAFLKILEEPPPYTLFLLVSDQPEQLLPTIISRTQRVNIPKLDEESMAGFLVSRFQADPEKAIQAAALSDGSISLALRLLSETNEDYHQLFMDWQRACFSANFAALLQHTDQFQALGKEVQKNFLRYCLNQVRKALVLSQGAGSVLHMKEQERNDLSRLGKALSLRQVEVLLQQLNMAYFHINQNASSRMIFFDTSLAIAASFKKTSIPA
jgi:DNA polymerase-3 subunit delta'